LDATLPISLYLSPLLVFRQNLIERSLQNRTWRAGVSEKIAAAIKETTARDMPHIVQADHHTNPAWQCFQPTWNIEPIGDGVKVYHVNFIQVFGRRGGQQSPRPVPRFARRRDIPPTNNAIQKTFEAWKSSGRSAVKPAVNSLGRQRLAQERRGFVAAA